MNIDLLIKMANEIGEFFSGADVNDPQGAGLTDLARNAVALLYAASKAPATSAGSASAPAKGAGT